MLSFQVNISSLIIFLHLTHLSKGLCYNQYATPSAELFDTGSGTAHPKSLTINLLHTIDPLGKYLSLQCTVAFSQTLAISSTEATQTMKKDSTKNCSYWKQKLHSIGVSKVIFGICRLSSMFQVSISIFVNCAAVTVNTDGWTE